MYSFRKYSSCAWWGPHKRQNNIVCSDSLIILTDQGDIAEILHVLHILQHFIRINFKKISIVIFNLILFNWLHQNAFNRKTWILDFYFGISPKNLVSNNNAKKYHTLSWSLNQNLFPHIIVLPKCYYNWFHLFSPVGATAEDEAVFCIKKTC